MFSWNRSAKINFKVLIVLILVTVALVTSLFAAREVRRNILSKTNLDAGQTAFDKKDWATACKHFQHYLARNPDDVDVLKKYAKAHLSVTPLEATAVSGAIAAYRRVIQLDPLDDVAYKKLTQLYAYIGNFEEVAYVGRSRLELVPDDLEAPLWLAEALIRLHRSDDAHETLVEFIAKLQPLVQKPDEYGHACVLMSQITSGPGAVTADKGPLDWLNQAVDNCPESADAFARRARFYGQTQISGMTEDDRTAQAHKDLKKADSLGTEDPRIRLLLAAEWLEQGDLERVTAELQAVENLPSQALQEYFLDTRDCDVARFLLASQLAIKSKDVAKAAKGAEKADKVLAVLTETKHRVQVLPSAIELYVAARRVADASDCLNEYLGAMYTQEGPAESRLGLAYLQALVAKAEDKLYVVIDVLQPAVVSDAARPELWRLLADAFSRTDQTRRAIGALINYLRIRPQDSEMTQQLAKEYLKIGDSNNALKAVLLAEAIDPTDIAIKLLRIKASIYQIAERTDQIDPSILKSQSERLAQLRKDDPNRVDVRILQASIADLLDKPKEAEKELEQAIEECSDPLPARMQLARHYQRVGLKDKALSICETACEGNPEAAEPWLTLSELYVARADYDSAGKVLERGIESIVDKWKKRSLWIRLALLELLYKDDPDNAENSLIKITDQDELEVYARYLLLGVLEVKLNREKAERKLVEAQHTREKAEKIIEELKTSEGQSGLYWRMGQAALWLSADDWRSRQPDITAALQKCIDSNPEWSAPTLLLVKMYEKLADIKHMEETCRQALVRNQSATDVADALISVLEKQGRYSDALAVLAQVEGNANPRWISARRLGVDLNSGEFSRAIDELTLRVKKDDRDANSRILLARLVYLQTKDAGQAFAFLNEAEAISPKSMMLAAAKVAILKDEGKEEKARQVLDAYVDDSKTFSAYAMRAKYLSNSGQLEEAAKDYRKLTSFPQKEVDGYELLSDFYARNEKLDDAVTALRDGLDAYPDDLRLTRRLMKTLFARGRAEDKEEARELLGDLQEKLGDDPELLEIEVITTRPDEPNKADLQIAYKKLQKVVKLEPTAVDAHLMLIGIAMSEGQYEVARDSAVRALGSNPDNSALLSARAEAERNLKNTRMAAQLAQMALETDPNNAKAKDIIITVALSSKDTVLLEQSCSLVDSALVKDPANEELLLLRTHILVSMRKAEAAIPEMEAYCRTEKGKISIQALMALAELYRLNGNTDMAEQTIQQAEKLDGNNPLVIRGRLSILASQNRFDELLQIGSAYLSAKEQDPNMVVEVAKVLASLDSMKLKKEAVRLFELAVSLAPTSKPARLGLANTLYQTGDADGAKEVYKELLSEYPNEIQVLNNLAWIIQERDHSYAAALKLVDRALKLAPAAAQVGLLDTRATILFNMGNHLREARDDYGRIVALSAQDSREKAVALLNLGRTCSKLNDATEAKKHLQRALDIDRKNSVFTESERSEVAELLQAEGL